MEDEREKNQDTRSRKRSEQYITHCRAIGHRNTGAACVQLYCVLPYVFRDGSFPVEGSEKD